MERLMFGKQGILTEGEGPVQLTNLIKAACFVKKINNVFVTSASFCHFFNEEALINHNI
jgi:hypothetical protein